MALLARPRILESLFDSKGGATLITAGSGFGKSVAVRQFLAASPRSAIHYEVRASSKTFVPFVRGFVDAAARAIPGLQTTFPGAIEYAMQSPKPHEEIAVWLLDHLSGATAEVIAIEDAHHAGSDEQVRLLLARLIQSSAPKTRWIFTSCDASSVPLDELADSGVRISTVDAEQLRFTRAEAEIVARDAGLARELVDGLYALTGGWPAAFHLGAHVFDGGRIPCEQAYAFFAQAYFVRCREDVQSMLMGAAVLSDIDEELLQKSPWAPCIERVRDLARNGLVFSARAGGRYVFHEMFRRFLLERIGPAGSGGRRSAMMYGASLLERCGRIADALSLYEYAGDIPNVVRLCELHGFELLDKGEADNVRRALKLAGSDLVHKSATLMALAAIEESQAGRHDTAGSWYILALKLAGSLEQRASIAYRYALDLAGQNRTDAITLLEPYVGEAELPVELKASIQSTLAVAYVVMGRFEDAKETSNRALRLIPLADSPSLQAKIYQQSAWVALFTGDITASKQYGTKAAELAVASDMYDIAARAYSVLHNIAYDIEDDAQASLTVLNKLWDCSLKCGSQKGRLFALLGTFDLAADLGDIQTLLRIERTLDAYDVDYGDPLIDEGLLPGQALRLAASGDFLEAYRLLSPTGERQQDPDRRALRFAEIAMYAAAAGFMTEASCALKEAERCVRDLPPQLGRTVRIRALIAITLFLLGRVSEATLCLRVASASAQGASRRMQVLAASVDVLFAYWSGKEGHAAVLDTLEEMRAADLGGIAAVLAALPSDLAGVAV